MDAWALLEKVKLAATAAKKRIVVLYDGEMRWVRIYSRDFPSSVASSAWDREGAGREDYFRFLFCLRCFLRSSARSFGVLRCPVPIFVFGNMPPGLSAPALPIPISIFSRSNSDMF